MSSARTYRVAPLPDWRENAYLDLFYGHLERIEAHREAVPVWPPDAYLDALAAVDAVHFHWPEHYWRGSRGRATPKSLFDFHRLLRRTRAAGRAVFWTVHNLRPHVRPRPLDRIGARLLARSADLIICHDEETRARVRRRFRPAAPLVVMPHGNYGETFPGPRPGTEVRAELGLDPARPVAAVIGLMRAYKGLDLALAAAAKRPGLQLLIAGQPGEDVDAEALRTAVAASPGGGHVAARRLSDQEVADFHAAADVVLLPYRRVTGSGALLAALTLGRAVVASDLPFFRETLAGHPKAGRLAPLTADGFAAAIGDLLAAPDTERRAAALALAATFDWSACAARVEPAMLTALAGADRAPPA